MRGMGFRGFLALAVLAVLQTLNLAAQYSTPLFGWGKQENGELGNGYEMLRPEPVRTLFPPGVTVDSVSGWSDHSLALADDGTVWAWGRNYFGQLGNGQQFLDEKIPAQICELENIIAISAGAGHCLALDGDGNVWAWGNNTGGLLGDGTTTGSFVPVQVTGLAGISAIDAGADRSLAIDASGNVWTWGQGFLSPVQVSGISNATAVSAGSSHALALLAGGTVMAWGSNADGQLGNGTNNPSAVPVQVSNLTGITAVEAGGDHSLALDMNGVVWAWGENYRGQLGDNSFTDSNIPVQVFGLSGMSGIGAGKDHSFSWNLPGAGYSWGNNFTGQLGDGTTGSSGCPVPILAAFPASDISGGNEHSLAAGSDGSVWSWGSNEYGRLGIDEFPVVMETPVPVGFPQGTILKSIFAGFNYSLSVKSEGTIWMWDDSVEGPTRVTDVSDAEAVVGGIAHYLVRRGDSTVWAWGDNTYGQLGDGTNDGSTEPVEVLNIDNISQVAAGQYHSMALKGTDGTVWSWGLNDCGQLGDGSKIASNLPVQVVDPLDPTGYLTGATTIACGPNHSFAVKQDGSLWAWGDDWNGNLGNGDEVGDSNLPIKVLNLTAVESVAAGEYHSLACQTDGSVWVWGENDLGQLGDPTLEDSPEPVQLTGISGVVSVSAGWKHSLALTGDGEVWQWGWGLNEECCPPGSNGGIEDITEPRRVSGIGSVAGISAGRSHKLAVSVMAGTCSPPSQPVITSVVDEPDCGVTISFAAGSPATRHDLYEDGWLAGSGISSPWQHVAGDSAGHGYKVRTINDDEACFKDSVTVYGRDYQCPVSLPPEVSPGGSPGDAVMWSEDKATLFWAACADPVDGYYVYRGNYDDLTELFSEETDSCSRYEGTDIFIDASPDDPSAQPFGLYWFLVTAFNLAGEGPAGHGRIVNSYGGCGP